MTGGTQRPKGLARGFQPARGEPFDKLRAGSVEPPFDKLRVSGSGLSTAAPHAPRFLAWPKDSASQERTAGRAAEVLRVGGLLVYPTDTVYGLGAHPACDSALRRIYEVKGRPDEKAIVWLLASANEAPALCEFGPHAAALAARFWPGPLTMVLRRRAASTDGLATLALRIPAHPAALAIIHAAGGAVPTTSANRSGQPSARTAIEAATQLGTDVDLIVDAGPTPGGVESTVLDLTTSPPAILRPGPIPPRELAEALGIAGSSLRA